MAATKDDAQGCMTIIGVTIVALCVGALFGDVYGWLVIGFFFLAIGMWPD